MSFSSFKKSKLLFESWRGFMNEAELGAIAGIGDEPEEEEEEQAAPAAPAAEAPAEEAPAEEEPAEEKEVTGLSLEDWMAKTLEQLPSPPIDALSQDAKNMINKGNDDGQPTDDKQIDLSSEEQEWLSFENLQASQNEVGMNQSMRNTLSGDPEGAGKQWDGIDYGDVKTLIELMKEPGKAIQFKSPIAAAQTADGYVILDGHHRWSQAMMLNPTGQINAVVFQAPNMSTDDVLQALHLGVYAVAGKAGIKAASGGNLFKAEGEDVLKYIQKTPKEKYVSPKTLELDPNGVPPYVAAVMNVKGISDPATGVTAAKDYALGAVKVVSQRVVAGAPDRTKMPQTDTKVNPGATPEAVGDELGSGEINYAEPFNILAPGRTKATSIASTKAAKRGTPLPGKKGPLAFSMNEQKLRQLIKQVLKESLKKAKRE